jgi:hypothetical protein
MTAAAHDPTNVRTLDVSGNGLNGTFGDGVTGTTFPTKLNDRRGYYFDGGDYLALGDLPILDFGATGTICCLFKTRDTSAQYHNLICKQNWPGGSNGYAIHINFGSNIIRTSLYGGATPNVVDAGIVRTLDPVHFCAGYWTGSKVYIYLDGYINSVAQTINPTSSGYSFRVGAASSSNSYSYNGNIHHVAAWNYALSELQLRDLEARLRRQLNDI